MKVEAMSREKEWFIYDIKSLILYLSLDLNKTIVHSLYALWRMNISQSIALHITYVLDRTAEMICNNSKPIVLLFNILTIIALLSIDWFCYHRQDEQWRVAYHSLGGLSSIPHSSLLLANYLQKIKLKPTTV